MKPLFSSRRAVGSAALAATLLAAQISLAGGHIPGLGGKGPIGEALASEVRTADEKARDRNRQPRQTLDFFKLKTDMRVIEIMPGGGWYTKILVPVLRDQGEYIAVGGLGKAMGFGDILGRVTGLKGFEDIRIVDISGDMSKTERRGYLNVGPVDFGVQDVDLVLTFRNLHNFTSSGRYELAKGAYAALKDGGHYGVVDHTRRHMASMTDETWRRLDPVQVIQEATAAGFTLVDYSRLHYKPDDELRFEVGRKSVRGNSDRFTLLFKK
ncbi:MAG: class I SAM-dependent methyltransferase [Gammaproteobacteria bacterium]